MKYFAAESPEFLADYLDKRMSDWSSQIKRNGLKLIWQKCYYTYYGRHWKVGNLFQDNDIAKLGISGELQGLTVNDFRNLIKHMLVLTTNQKISYEPRATNTDERSITQTRLAKLIIDYYTREKKVSRYLHDCAELALVMGKAFLKVTWDKQAGKPYEIAANDDGSQRMVYEGDVKIRLLDPFSVYVDQSTEGWERVQHTTDLDWVNRWDLIAEHPEMEEQILGVPVKSQYDGYSYMSFEPTEDSDLVAVKEFYHKRTPAMPNGRFVRFLSKECIFEDQPIQYDALPIFMMTPGKWYGSTEGYSESRDLLNLQQASNVVWSTIFSNIATFGVQNVLIPEGCNLSAFQIGGGLQALKYNPAAGKPEPLQLTESPKEIYKFIEILTSRMETIMGLNSITRGNVGEELSGKAMGLLQSMSIQYASAFQASYAETAEDVGTFILKLIKAFAKVPQMISVAGKFNKADMIQFTGSDIDQVERVVVELQNPYMSTLAGKKEVAQELLQNGMLKNPQEYLTFLESGVLQTMTEGPEAQQALIRAENEAMQDGKPVIAMKGDAHLEHMREHLCLLSKPEIRFNSPILNGVVQHLMQHEQLKETQGPLYDMLTGEPPVPMPMPPPGMMGPPGPPQGPPPHGAPPPHGKGKPMPGPGPQQGNPQEPPQPNIPPPPGPAQALQQALR